MRAKTIILSIMFVAPMVIAGCQTKSPDRAKYVKNGVQYPVLSGTFRGRWWNYYERGRSWLEGGYYDEAENDFRAALAQRDQDQLWARTYGLHLLPRYFPNRELGVALYYQGKYDESLKSLEKSLNEQPSARANYFANSVRRNILRKTGGDPSPPAVQILAPEAAAPVASIATEVVGIATAPNFVESITVNDEPVLVRISGKEVEFRHPITMHPGDNRIRVSVTDLLGNTTNQAVDVRADHDGPLVSFDELTESEQVVSGLAADPSGIESVVIGQRAANLETTPDGIVRFSVRLPEDAFLDPLKFAATDGLGNRTHGDVLTEQSERTADASRRLKLAANLLPHTLPQIIAVPERPRTRNIVNVELTNLADQDVFLTEEIAVNVRVSAELPLQRVELNGEPLPMLTAPSTFVQTRRIAIEHGDNDIRAVAYAIDNVNGREYFADDEKVVRREQSDLDTEYRLHVTIADIENNFHQIGPNFGDRVARLLEERIEDSGRFVVVDRSRLEDVLGEKKLQAALSSNAERTQIKRLAGAEVFLYLSIAGDAESISLELRRVSVETAEPLLSGRPPYRSTIDAAGRFRWGASQAAANSDLEQRLDDLTQVLLQEFPRVRGAVQYLTASEADFAVTIAHRIGIDFPCVLYRLIEETRGPRIVTDIEVLAEGFVDGVREDFSTARLDWREDHLIGDLPPTDQSSYFVIMK